MRSCDAYGAELSSGRGSNLWRLALLAGLGVLLLVAVGWGWTAHRRVADAEVAAPTVVEMVPWRTIYGLFAPILDRETAVRGLGERKAVLSEAQASAYASAAKIAELEQQVQALDGLLAGANAEVTRLRSELLAQKAAARAATAPVPTAAPASAEPVAALAYVEPAPPTPELETAAAKSAAPAPVATAAPAESVATLGSVEPAPPTPELETAAARAAPAPVPTAAPAEPVVTLGSVEMALHTPEPAVEPERLSITFKANSSYLPSGGPLRALAARLAADHSYAVRLIGSVGNDDVAGKSAEGALRYNRWIAERRVERVANYLQRTAKGQDLKIVREFATNDPSRRVLVEMTPATD